MRHIQSNYINVDEAWLYRRKTGIISVENYSKYCNDKNKKINKKYKPNSILIFGKITGNISVGNKLVINSDNSTVYEILEIMITRRTKSKENCFGILIKPLIDNIDYNNQLKKLNNNRLEKFVN